MKAITIELENGEKLTISKQNGETRINCENVFPIVVLENCGLPGIIGPTFEYNLFDLHQEDCIKAQMRAL